MSAFYLATTALGCQRKDIYQRVVPFPGTSAHRFGRNSVRLVGEPRETDEQRNFVSDTRRHHKLSNNLDSRLQRFAYASLRQPRSPRGYRKQDASSCLIKG